MSEDDAGEDREKNESNRGAESRWWMIEALMWLPDLIVAGVRMVVGLLVALVSSCS